MAAIIAVLALLISLSSFVFSIYQFRILNQVRVGVKITTLLRFAHDIRRKSEDLKDKIESTDDIPDSSEVLAKINASTEEGIINLLISRKLSWEDLNKIEQHLLPLDLEIDLLYKQILEVDRFNEEIRAYKEVREREI